MAKFPSDEGAKEYVEKLNSNPAYGDAGKTWDIASGISMNVLCLMVLPVFCDSSWAYMSAFP